MSGNYPRTHRLLDADEELALVTQAQAGDTTARDELILCNLNLVHKLATRYYSPDPAVEYDDLVQQGILGLFRAIDKYDAGFGRRYYAYAADWVRATITRYIETNHPIRRPANWRYNAEARQTVEALGTVLSLDAPATQSAYYDLGEVTPDHQPGPETLALNAILLEQALAVQHTDIGRQALRLRYQGYSCDEIGKRLGKSRGFATHAARHAREILNEETE